MSLEYVFAVLMWVIVCTMAAQVLGPYVLAFASQSSFRAYSSAVHSVGEVAASDVDGIRYHYLSYRVDGNFTFNNTSTVLKVGGEEALADFPVTYSYSDIIEKGDVLLIKNQDGNALAVREG